MWDLTDPKSAQAAASQGYVHDAPGSDAIAVPLGPGRDAYQAGTASLDRFEDLARIITDIAPGPTGAFQPVHIHSGSCKDLGPVVYRLGSVPGPGLEPVGVGAGYVPGKMSTLLDADLSKLLSGEFAIEVHESEEKQGVSVARGDIRKARRR